MKLHLANRIAPDGTPRSAASHLGLFCLPMSLKREARLKLVNINDICYPIVYRITVQPLYNTIFGVHRSRQCYE